MNPRIIVLTLATLAFGSTAFIFTGVLNEVANDLGVSVAVAGQLQTAYVLASALTGPPLALMLGKQDRKTLLLLGLGGLAVLNVVCALGGGFTTLLILRTLMGAIGGIIGPAASISAATLAPPEKRGSAMAAVLGGITLAFMVGIPLGSVVGAAFGWRASFGLAALFAAIAFVAIAFVLPKVVPQVPTVRTAAPWRRVAPLVSVSFIAFSANALVNSYIAPILKSGAGVSGASVASFQALIGFGSVLGLSLGGRGANAGAARWAMIAAFGVQAVALCLHAGELRGGAASGWPTYVAVGVAMFLLSAAIFALVPMVQTRILEAAGESATVGLAMNSSANSLGQAFGAAFGGLVLAHAGVLGLPLWGLALAGLGALVCAFALPKAA